MRAEADRSDKETTVLRILVDARIVSIYTALDTEGQARDICMVSSQFAKG